VGSTAVCIRDKMGWLEQVDLREAILGPSWELSQTAPPCQADLDQETPVEASVRYHVFQLDLDLFYQSDWSNGVPYHLTTRPFCHPVPVCFAQTNLPSLAGLVLAVYRQDMERDVCGSRVDGSSLRRRDTVESSQSSRQEESEMSAVCWMEEDSYICRKQLNPLEAWDLSAC
jgi:hypothetical protein